MHLSLALKRALWIVGIGLLVVIVGVALATRTDSAPASSQPAVAGNPEPVAWNSEPVSSNPEPVAGVAAAASATPPVYATSPFGTSPIIAQARPTPLPAPMTEPAVQPMPPSSYVAPEPVRTVPSAYRTRRVVRSRYHRAYYARPRTRVVVRRRPFSHSAAIVGGSAAGGAAIGALAGGGKGALAGGLVGGVGGLVYDRITHKKRVVVTR